MRFRTILCDPPWPQVTSGKYRNHKHHRPDDLPYDLMSLDDIAALPVQDLADDDCNLFLWTTQSQLPHSFKIMETWGFRYANTITWIKPSGAGNFFVSRCQFLLFGYKGKLRLKERFRPNVLFASPKRHSAKPEVSYELIEAVSFEPRIELFARQQRPGWTTLGDAIDGLDIRQAIKETTSTTK